MITEEECARRISVAMLEHEREIDRLREQLKQEKFHRAVAEWAVDHAEYHALLRERRPRETYDPQSVPAAHDWPRPFK